MQRPVRARRGPSSDADLARRRGRVSDLIGLIIEATGLQAEVGEVCMVGDGRDRPPVATEVVGFRGGRTLLMPLGELHGIGPGTSVHPTGTPFRVAVGEPLLGRVIDGLGQPARRMPTHRSGGVARVRPAPPPDRAHAARGSPTASASASARSTRLSRAAAASASASSPARASASPRCWA